MKSVALMMTTYHLLHWLPRSTLRVFGMTRHHTFFQFLCQTKNRQNDIYYKQGSNSMKLAVSFIIPLPGMTPSLTTSILLTLSDRTKEVRVVI